MKRKFVSMTGSDMMLQQVCYVENVRAAMADDTTRWMNLMACLPCMSGLSFHYASDALINVGERDMRFAEVSDQVAMYRTRIDRMLEIGVAVVRQHLVPVVCVD